MKNLNCINHLRVEFFGNMGDEYNGAFNVKIRGETYQVIASNGGGWEHVSVSSTRRVPGWDTMCEIKNMFFEPDEVVMQLHPAKTNYVNVHKNCLHLWRPLEAEIPLPPAAFV